MKCGLISSVLALFHALSFAAAAGNVTVSNTGTKRTCTVYTNVNQQDDVPNNMKVFTTCNNSGTVVFPQSQTYWIATKLNPVLNDVTVDWYGEWLYSTNLTYWRQNSYPIAFQNHHAGFIVSGQNIHIYGYNTGGINSNGNAWYNVEKNFRQPGCPMPFVWWNVSDVTVTDFYVKDPQLWSLNIMNGTNMYFSGITCNATAINAPYGVNSVQNTDGFDTMDVENIYLQNFVYQRGDDCIAIKPLSNNVKVRNATCHGGNGMAIGSLGQYLVDSSVENIQNIQMDDVTILPHNGGIGNGAYIKTWIGSLQLQPASENGAYESGGVPRGGGWGVVRNVLLSNFKLNNASDGTAITQNTGNNDSAYAPSKMQVSNVALINFTGFTAPTAKSDNVVECSMSHPCFNIAYEDVLNGTGKSGVQTSFSLNNNTVGPSSFVPSIGG